MKNEIVETEQASKPLAQDDDDEIDIGPFITYLQSDKGHSVAERVLAIWESSTGIGAKNRSRVNLIEVFGKYIVIIIVIGGTVWLSQTDSFTGSVGFLFGSIVGYFFGRKQDA